MAVYQPRTQFEKDKVRRRLEQLIESGDPFELTNIKRRSLSQNNYLHLCLSYLGLELGYSLAYTKLRLLKLTWCKDVFLVDKVSSKTGEKFTDIRSTADLNKEEMIHVIGVLIEKAQLECNVRLPNPTDLTYQDEMQQIAIEVYNNQKYL